MDTTLEQQLKTIERNGERLEEVGKEHKQLVEMLVEKVDLPEDVEEKMMETADKMESIGKSSHQNIEFLMKRLSAMEDTMVN